MSKFPTYRQLGAADCGVACLRMIAAYYGKKVSVNNLKKISEISRTGVSFYNIMQAAETIGISCRPVEINFEALEDKSYLPAIVHWEQKHFVVVYKVSKKWVYVADPAMGSCKYSHEEFIEKWQNGRETGFALFFRPTTAFYASEFGEEENGESFSSLFSYLKYFRKYFFQLLSGLLLGSVLMASVPFLTQILIDDGIQNGNPNLIYILIFAQLVLYLSRVSVEIVRRVTLLHTGARVYVSLVSAFITKLLKLSHAFFERHQFGDLIQRIYDHRRLEALLTAESLNAVFAVVNGLLFSIILAFYDPLIFVVFAAISVISYFWIRIFIRRRNFLDNLSAKANAKSLQKISEIIHGFAEIKISNSYHEHRNKWESEQGNLFEINLRKDSVYQWQEIGAELFNQFNGLAITLIAAMNVLHGSLSLGGMFAIMFLVGQLAVPYRQLMQFVMTLSDAKLAHKRIGEIHQEPDEQVSSQHYISDFSFSPEITFKNVSFQYSSNMDFVLKNVNFSIPYGKTTAIVGESGCGKSTIVKLLLGFMGPSSGGIMVGSSNLKNIIPDEIRSRVGAVLQDGFLFSDTIAKNIALGQDINMKEVIESARLAAIDDFIRDELPMAYNTKIGSEGQMLSRGQQQRILLARALYKKPELLILDEATSALDASNELTVMKNLFSIFQSKTLIIIAHRLSTVTNANQVIVMNKNGTIAEIGNHLQLINQEGVYYNLIKNQLELGVA